VNAIIVRCVAGPDAGWSQRLAVGSHWIGRAPGGVCIIDPAMEPHLARLDVGPDGSTTVLQATGRIPMLIAANPAEGRVRITDGTVLEFAGTRLEFGPAREASCGAAGWVYEPQDTSVAELARFERDVGLAAAASRRRLLAEQGADTVELGVAAIAAPLDVRAADGTQLAHEALSLAAQAVLDRACAVTVPLRIALDAGVVLGVVAPDPDPVVASILAQLDPARRAAVIVVDAADALGLAASRRPILVTATAARRLPPCHSLIEIGAMWRATWQPDLCDHPDQIVHFHARGKSARR
jgi:hypothetical protein